MITPCCIVPPKSLIQVACSDRNADFHDELGSYCWSSPHLVIERNSNELRTSCLLLHKGNNFCELITLSFMPGSGNIATVQGKDDCTTNIRI